MCKTTTTTISGQSITNGENKNSVPFPYQQTAQQTIALHPSAGQHRPHVGKLQRSGDMDIEQRYTPDTVRNIKFFINPIQFNRENLGLII